LFTSKIVDPNSVAPRNATRPLLIQTLGVRFGPSLVGLFIAPALAALDPLVHRADFLHHLICSGLLLRIFITNSVRVVSIS
jgi:hypothetical protein